MKPYGVSHALQNDVSRIVVEQDTRHSAKKREGILVASQEVGDALVQEEFQEDRPGPREHHHEGHQLTLSPPDLNPSEVPPIDLALLSRERPESEKRFWSTARPQASDHDPEVVLASGIPSFANHLVNTTRADLRILGEGLDDERDERVGDRGAWQLLDGGNSGVAKHALHGVVMNLELCRDRVDAPLFGQIQPENLGFHFGRNHWVCLHREDDPVLGALSETSAPASRTKVDSGRWVRIERRDRRPLRRNRRQAG